MAEDPARVAKALKVLEFVESCANEFRMVIRMAHGGKLNPKVQAKGSGDNFWIVEEVRYQQLLAIEDLGHLINMAETVQTEKS